MSEKKPATYKDAGVDIDAGEELIRRIKPAVKKTFGPEVASDLGLFGGAFRLDTSGMTDPVLISSTDGVGTKTLVATWANRHRNIGRDLVHHCINDIFTCGARPLFFLDYYATSKLDVDVAEAVIGGLAEACADSKVALVGGETAEMPAVYHEGGYDLAGTIVGVVDAANMIDGSKIQEGDMLIALPSSGLHTNGYTLARKVLIEQTDFTPTDVLPGMDVDLADALLAPHTCYACTVSRWLDKRLPVHGMAHITGGGIAGNTKRIIPEGLRAEIEWDRWQWPQLFNHIHEMGEVPVEDMRRTFNLGVGWVMILPAWRAKELIIHSINSDLRPFRIGTVVKD
ncbi:phosphoribosylformylglycinamidine cyclo-ligase [bacterium]|nr:phosphoribosylformylglycinamidine cyclo-ligase [bacterium]